MVGSWTTASLFAVNNECSVHGDRLQPHGSRLRFCREACLDRLDDADNRDRWSVHRKREQKRLPAASVSGVVKSTVAMSSAPKSAASPRLGVCSLRGQRLARWRGPLTARARPSQLGNSVFKRKIIVGGHAAIAKETCRVIDMATQSLPTELVEGCVGCWSSLRTRPGATESWLARWHDRWRCSVARAAQPLGSVGRGEV